MYCSVTDFNCCTVCLCVTCAVVVLCICIVLLYFPLSALPFYRQCFIISSPLLLCLMPALSPFSPTPFVDVPLFSVSPSSPLSQAIVVRYTDDHEERNDVSVLYLGCKGHVIHALLTLSFRSCYDVYMCICMCVCV